MIGAAVGRRVWTPHLPKPLLQLAARGDRLLRGDAAKLTADRVGYMTHPDWVCRMTQAVPANVWRPRISGPDGLANTVQWYRDAGWL